jgi:hypothetical protein
LPQFVADQRHARRAGPVFLRPERSSQNRGYAQRPKQVGRAERSVDPLRRERSRGAGQVEGRFAAGRHLVKAAGLFLPIQEVARRYHVERLRSYHVALEQSDQTLRIGVGQRLQQHRVHHAEHSRVAAQPQGQHYDRDDRETGPIPQLPQSELNVLTENLQAVEHGPSTK